MSDLGLFGLEFDSLKSNTKSPHKTGEGKNDYLKVGQANRVSMQYDFPAADTYTVQIDANLDSVQTPRTLVLTSVIVSWRVRGNTVKRVYDLCRGLMVSGNAEAVSVDVIDNSPVNTGDQYLISVSVSKTSRPTSATPGVRTGLANAAIQAGSFVQVAVPPGARSVAVFGSQFAGLQLYEYGGTAIGGLFATNTVLLYTDVVVAEWIPLVGGASIIQVNNTSGTATNASVVFEIDG